MGERASRGGTDSRSSASARTRNDAAHVAYRPRGGLKFRPLLAGDHDLSRPGKNGATSPPGSPELFRAPGRARSRRPGPRGLRSPAIAVTRARSQAELLLPQAPEELPTAPASPAPHQNVCARLGEPGLSASRPTFSPAVSSTSVFTHRCPLSSKAPAPMGHACCNGLASRPGFTPNAPEAIKVRSNADLSNDVDVASEGTATWTPEDLTSRRPGFVFSRGRKRCRSKFDAARRRRPWRTPFGGRQFRPSRTVGPFATTPQFAFRCAVGLHWGTSHLHRGVGPSQRAPASRRRLDLRAHRLAWPARAPVPPACRPCAPVPLCPLEARARCRSHSPV